MTRTLEAHQFFTTAVCMMYTVFGLFSAILTLTIEAGKVITAVCVTTTCITFCNAISTLTRDADTFTTAFTIVYTVYNRSRIVRLKASPTPAQARNAV